MNKIMDNQDLKQEIKQHLIRNYSLGDTIPEEIIITSRKLINIIGCYALEHCHLRCAMGMQSYSELDQEQKEFLEDLFNDWFRPGN